MAWMRTSLSLFAFGFSISRFFAYLEELQGGTQYSVGPRRLGIVLICLGVLGLLLAIVSHVRRIQRMKELGLPTGSRSSLAIAAAAALVVVGVVACIAIILNAP
jgi:putative membrane protein